LTLTRRILELGRPHLPAGRVARPTRPPRRRDGAAPPGGRRYRPLRPIRFVGRRRPFAAAERLSTRARCRPRHAAAAVAWRQRGAARVPSGDTHPACEEGCGDRCRCSVARRRATVGRAGGRGLAGRRGSVGVGPPPRALAEWRAVQCFRHPHVAGPAV